MIEGSVENSSGTKPVLDIQTPGEKDLGGISESIFKGVHREGIFKGIAGLHIPPNFIKRIGYSCKTMPQCLEISDYPFHGAENRPPIVIHMPGVVMGTRSIIRRWIELLPVYKQ